MIFQDLDLLFIILPIVIFVVIFFGCWLLAGIKVILEYERLVIFRLGKYKRTIGPGVVYVLPIFEKSRKVSLRIITEDIPRQEVITKDNIPVLANTVVYFKVERPEDAVIKIENYTFAVRQYTQAALRDVVGNMELDSVLSEREKIATDIRSIVDQETSEWGIDIKSIKIQEIELPAEMKRAMAKQAEAEREKRSRIIIADGELQAAKKMTEAAVFYEKTPTALRLRELQTLAEIAREKNLIVVPGGDIGKVTGIAKAVTTEVKK